MNARLKLTGRLHDIIVKDLMRPHPFALERVGFVFGRIGSGLDGTSVVLLTHYHAVADDQYIDDPKVGARIGPEAKPALLAGLHANTCSTAGLRRGRTDPPDVGRTTHSARGSRIDQRAGTTGCRSALEPLGGRRGLTDPRVTDSAGAKA